MSLTWRGVRPNWLPAHTDALVVIVVAAAGQQEVWTPGWQLAHIVGPGWVNSLGYLLCAAALWWRRRAPLRVIAFIAAVDIAQFLAIGASQGLGAFLPGLATTC